MASAETEAGQFSYTDWYAEKRSDFYLKRAAQLSSGAPACRRLTQAALDISPGNETVAALAASLGCARRPSGEPSSLQVGPIGSWPRAGEPGASCEVPEGATGHDLFATPLGFVRISDVGLRDWRRTLAHLEGESVKRFERMVKRGKGQRFMDLNNRFFQEQLTNPDDAMRNPEDWPEMYASPEYREWAGAARRICSSYLRKVGTPLSQSEEEQMEVVVWAAVYPQEADVTHLYHAHQESIVSFVLYVAMPEPTTPMTVADPRGAPPIEDYEWFQGLGDLGVDAEPPFHRTLEFFAGAGDVLVFPSYAIHKVPPHLGRGTRVAWPANCHLPKVVRGSAQHPLDGWERSIRWPDLGALRPSAAQVYLGHARAVLAKALRVEDPFMKVWEALNHVVAYVQSDPLGAEAWLNAGDLLAQLAVVLAAREEGDYFPDALVFWARALRLDPSLGRKLEKVLQSLEPAKPPRALRDGYAVARTWVRQARAWSGQPPEGEFVQFLAEELNGPGRCDHTCPSSAGPSVELATRQLFTSRVLVAWAPQPEVQLRVLARAWLGDVEVVLQEAPLAQCWRRNETASLGAVACGDDGERVWFADPRGMLPEGWEGAVPIPRAEGCVSEPKAPFHRHRELVCRAGEALLFPAWLPFMVPEPQRGTRLFLVSVPARQGAVGWSVPAPQPWCRAPTPRSAASVEL